MSLFQFSNGESADLSAHWMPFSANRQFHQTPRIIAQASGSWFKDKDGRDIYDSLSGLWTCGAGHSRAEIQKAVAEQLGTLDYSPAFQFGHELSFKTDAGSDRVKKAMALIEERFQELERRGRKLSKEKLLIYLALSLADDFLQTNEKIEGLEKALTKLLNRLDCYEE